MQCIVFYDFINHKRYDKLTQQEGKRDNSYDPYFSANKT